MGILKAYVEEARTLSREATKGLLKELPKGEGLASCVEAFLLSRALNTLVWGVEDGTPPTPAEAVARAARIVRRYWDVVRVLCMLLKAAALRLATRAAEGPATILDIGCGCGAALNAVTAAAPGGRVVAVGVDLSYGMLEVLRTLRPDALLIQGSAAPLPLRGSSVDEILAVSSLHEFPDLREFMLEVSRVLKPGGRALIVDTFSTPLTEFIFAAGRFVRRAFKKEPENPYGLDEVVEAAALAGLEVLKALRIKGGLRRFVGAVELLKPATATPS